MRAWVAKPNENAPRTGIVTLVAMRRRDDGIEPEEPPESAQWLESVRGRLAPRMPLGSRLSVVAPRYVMFSIEAIIEPHPGSHPEGVKDAVEKKLRQRLALLDSPGATSRAPGVPVTRRDVAAWIRMTNGVQGIVQLHLRSAEGDRRETIDIPRRGLPRWSPARSNLVVRRPEPGRPR
jgi:hypothetical protein